MTDPVTTAVAVALATKAVDGLTEAGKAAFAALARLVRRKLTGNQQSRTLDADTGTPPADDTTRQTLIDALRQAAADDQLFAEELHRLWRTVQHERIGAPDGSVVNSISGDVSGTVVQARDIHGGISFGRQ